MKKITNKLMLLFIAALGLNAQVRAMLPELSGTHVAMGLSGTATFALGAIYAKQKYDQKFAEQNKQRFNDILQLHENSNPAEIDDAVRFESPLSPTRQLKDYMQYVQDQVLLNNEFNDGQSKSITLTALKQKAEAVRDSYESGINSAPARDIVRWSFYASLAATIGSVGYYFWSKN